MNPNATREKTRFELPKLALDRWDQSLQPAVNSASKTIDILDVIGEDMWTGGGWTSKRMAAALRSVGEGPLTVYINSPGGDFFEGIAMHNQLREYHQSKGEVTVKVLGLAASAASVIAMSGGSLEVAKSGFLMIHNCWCLAIGNKENFGKVIDELKQFDDVSAAIYADRSGRDGKEITRMMRDETWMSGEKAVELGFADSLLAEQVQKAKQEGGATNAKRELERLFAKCDVGSRAEARQLIKKIESGTPGAAEPAMQDAGASLALAAANLRLQVALLND